MGIKETLESSKRINLLKDNPEAKKVADIVVSEALEPVVNGIEAHIQQNELEHAQIVETVGEQISTLKSEFDQKLATIELTPGEKGEPGKDGYTPIAGIDYEIPKDGQDYILKEEDKTEIASKIKVPVVEKIIEKTEVIKEIPVVQEVAKYEEAEKIADKLNTLEEKVDIKVIKGLENRLDKINRNATKNIHGGGLNPRGDTMTGDLTFANNAGIEQVNNIQFDTTPDTSATAEGELRWNSTDGTLNLGMQGGDITQQIGQELFIKVINKSGADIANGTPVYFSGRQGNRPKIYPAKSDADATSCVCGITTEDIDDNDEGYITTFGYVRQIKTDYLGWTEGDKLYVSKTTAGELTNTEPAVPHHSDIVGEVAVVGSAGIGSIFVNIQRHKTLEELSDVNGTALTTSGQIPIWDQTNQYFDFDFNVLQVHEAMKNPTGFPNRTDSTWTFTDLTRTLSISPTLMGGTFDYWISGVKYTISAAKTIEITDVEGMHYVYFDTDSVLHEYVNPTNGEQLTMIRDKVLVASIYWDATNNVGVLVGEERHGCVMDGVTHYYLHNTRGLQYVSGLGLGDFVIGTGALDSHAQFSVATGSISDEDIGLTVADIASTTGLPILYRDGANGYWRTVTQAGFSCYQNPAGTTNRLMYNQLTGGSWTTTEIGEGNYVLYHIFATTGKVNQIYSIMGQTEYTTVVSARLGAQSEISALAIGSLPSPEIRPIATVIFQTDKDYGNTINARIVEVDGVGTDDYVDWRTNDLPRGVTASDHGSLTGLLDDDHTQYSLVAGTRAFTGDVTISKVAPDINFVDGAFTSSLGMDGSGETQLTAWNGLALKAGTNVTSDTDIRGYDFVNRRSATYTRDGSGYITSVAKTGGRTITYTRSSGFVTSKTDTTNTWTYTRDGSNNVTAKTVT